MVKKLIIMGAAGRDFHNFNLCFKDNPLYREPLAKVSFGLIY